MNIVLRTLAIAAIVILLHEVAPLVLALLVFVGAGWLTRLYRRQRYLR